MHRSHRYRAAAPVVLAGVVALGAALPGLVASGAPSLPAVDPAQLISMVEQTQVQGLTGTVTVDANFGVPADLLSLAGGGSAAASDSGFSWTSLLSGTHNIGVWADGPSMQRLQFLRQLGETDIIHNAGNVWVWDSTTQKVVDYQLPARTSPGSEQAPPVPALTPQQIAQRLLEQVGSTTAVTVGADVTVAGHNAYTLSVAPLPGSAGAASSTIGRVDLAVDSSTGFVLRVEVFPRASGVVATSPALTVGFTGPLSLQPAAPSAFAAPHGLTTVTKTIGSGSAPAAGWGPSGPQATALISTPWAEVVRIQGAANQLPAAQLDAVTAPTSLPGSPRLFTTTFVNALIYPDGSVVAGAVSVPALEAAARS